MRKLATDADAGQIQRYKYHRPDPPVQKVSAFFRCLRFAGILSMTMTITRNMFPAVCLAIVVAMSFYNAVDMGLSTNYMDLGPTRSNIMYSTRSAEDLSKPLLDQWTSMVYDLASNLSSKISPIDQLPSKEKPFVFFHIRKGGGTNFRKMLYKSAEMRSLDKWIACEGDPCVPFSLPPPGIDEGRAIYAGHLNYAFMSQLIRERFPSDFATSIQAFQGHNVTYLSVQDDYMSKRTFGSCLTNIRPTVSRVTSCWNYRFVFTKQKNKNWTIPMASNATIEEWTGLLPEAVDKFGNGCNNEIARIFGRTQDESLVNHLSVRTHGPQCFLDELETVLSRMSTCVVVRIDRCQESQIILQHYLPWVNSTDLCKGHEKESTLSVDLRDGAREAILEQNIFDDLAFRFGEELFQAQLQVAQMWRGGAVAALAEDNDQPR